MSKITQTCHICGTVEEFEEDEGTYCSYCANHETPPDPKPRPKKSIDVNIKTSAVKISYQTLWDGFWAGLEEDPQQTYTKAELLSIKNFYEGMVK